MAFSGSGGVWAMANGAFQAVNYPGTAAGIQAAVDDLEASGGEIKVGPGTYAFGTTSLIIQGDDIRIRGSGNRSTIFTYSGTGDFVVFGADDGVHSGVADAYNGLSNRCVLEEIQIQGPGAGGGAARAIVDWEGGSQVFRGLTINAWDYGYFGIGADTSVFENCYFSANGYGAHLASRCDQNQFQNCYFTGSTSGALLLEYAQNCRIYGGQFVFNAYDIIVDAPASATGGADIRTDCGLVVFGTWFESATATPTTSHIHLGKNGASGRVTLGATVIGCYILVGTSASDCFIEVDAANWVNVQNCFQAGANFTTSFIKVNTVSGVSPVITTRDNRLTANTVFGGAGAGGALLAYERYQRTTNAIAFGASITPNMDGGGEIIEIAALTADTTINAPTNPRRGMYRIYRFVQDTTAGRTVTWNSVFKHSWNDAGNNVASARASIAFYYDGTNWQQVSYTPWNTGAGKATSPAYKGSDIASGATITLGAGDVFVVTGTADITSITATTEDTGRVVRLIFSGTAATNGVVDGSNLKLSANLAYSPDDTLSAVCDGTNWYELSRSVN